MKCFIKLQIPLKQGQFPDPYEGDMVFGVTQIHSL